MNDLLKQKQKRSKIYYRILTPYFVGSPFSVRVTSFSHVHLPLPHNQPASSLLFRVQVMDQVLAHQLCWISSGEGGGEVCLTLDFLSVKIKMMSTQNTTFPFSSVCVISFNFFQTITLFYIAQI